MKMLRLEDFSVKRGMTGIQCKECGLLDEFRLQTTFLEELDQVRPEGFYVHKQRIV